MKKRKNTAKRAVSLALSMAMVSSTALAAVVEHDIGTGSLNITDENYNADGYHVTGSSYENTITVNTSADKDVQITLDNVHIHTDDSAIDVGDSTVTLDLEGDNYIYSYEEAAVHVSSGDLTITSDTGGYLAAGNNWDYGTEAAAIGSNEDENMSGTITITGNAELNVDSDLDGAAIGSGEYGHMSGSIIIEGDADVDTESDDDGAGIGSGYHGNMSGSIIIRGNAYVSAESEDDGAGIGSGEGGDVSGSIFIGGNAYVYADSDEEGAGIGAGNTDYSSEDDAYIGGNITSTGSITITDHAEVEASADGEAAGIGSGETTNDGYYDENDNWVATDYYNGRMDGTITISGNALVYADSQEGGAAIGTSAGGVMNGTISILDQAQVYTDGATAIGPGYDAATGENAGYAIGSGAQIDEMPGSDLPALLEELNLDPALVNQVASIDTEDEVETTVLWNEFKDIKAIVYGDDAPKALIEKTVDAEPLALLTEGVDDENLIRTANLSFDGEYDGRIALWFYLGEEYAGQTIEIRTIVDGELMTYTIKANAKGAVYLRSAIMGDFVVTVK